MDAKWKMVIFDLDGLLVNTERMHWQAYERACREIGRPMNWSFDSYYQTASRSHVGVRDRLALEHPNMFSSLTWEDLYQKKQTALFDILEHEPMPLMPGAEEILERGSKHGLQMACVTHSRARVVEIAKSQHPVLSRIKSWYTRECYEKPKPAPDGYIKAINEAGFLPEEVIGLEDSLRGIQAQQEARITSVLVTEEVESQKEAENIPNSFVFSTLFEVIRYAPFSQMFGK